MQSRRGSPERSAFFGAGGLIDLEPTVMKKRDTRYRYTVSDRELRPYSPTTGSYFEVSKAGDGKWYWQLFLRSSPAGPAARSAQGYASQAAAQFHLICRGCLSKRN